MQVKLNENKRAELKRLLSRLSSPQGLVVRSRIILQAAERNPDKQIAATLGLNPASVTRWTQRWERGQKNKEPILHRLMDMPRIGCPSLIKPEQLCQLAAPACEESEAHGLAITHWTRRELADEAIK